jgi:multiple sugar transport system ATP-binding protein
MNFLPGRVDGTTLHLPIGDVTLPESHRKAVEGKDLVIAGLRPEHFEDASVLDSGRRERGAEVEVDVDVTEWLGNELYAYVPFEPDPAVAQQLEELDRDLDGEGMRTQLVVALDAMSRVRDGDRATLWFDPSRILLFEPGSGENLTRDDAEAARIGEENEQVRQASLERSRQT